MQTDKGKVSVYPVTVYKTAEARATGKTGVPCLAIHKSHFKIVMWRLYSACRSQVKTHTFDRHLHSVMCRYNSEDDHDLLALSGLEPFNNKEQRRKNGFMLLYAEWFDVMRHFFLEKDCLRDVGAIFRERYNDNGVLNVRGKFAEKYRCVWLGEEREVDTNAILQECNMAQNMSQTRLRALNGEIRIGVNGRLWTLPPGNKEDSVKYQKDAFAYGVECWDDQLRILNTMCAYFNDGAQTKTPSHMQGLLVLEDLPVKRRMECIRQGIFNKKRLVQTGNAIRRQRRKLSREFGGSLANFWGRTQAYRFKDPTQIKSKAVATVCNSLQERDALLF
jgi:hypothetical protein